MNTKMMIVICFAFACVGARQLSVFGDLDFDFSNSAFDGSIFDNFQTDDIGGFYGFDAAGVISFDASAQSDNGFATGSFDGLSLANNTGDNSGFVDGFAKLVTLADDQQSGTGLQASLDASANGEGVAGSVANGDGSAQFGNNNAAFNVFGLIDSQSQDAIANLDINASSVAGPDFSSSSAILTSSSNGN